MKKLYFTLLIIGQCVFAQNKIEQDTTKSQELENVFVTANRTATLRKETPLIQVIDIPILPLKNDKIGKFKGFVAGGILGCFLIILFLFII